MYKKLYDYLNVIMDIIAVMLIQIVIIFLLIVIPSIVLIMKTAGEMDSAMLTFQSMSSETMREIIESSMLIQVLKTIGVCIGIWLAPTIYEKVGTNKQKKDTEFVRRYLRGFYLNITKLITGACMAVAAAGVVILFTVIIEGNTKITSGFANSGAVQTVWLIISLALKVLCREIFSRYYVMLKTEGYGKKFFIVLSNVLFVYTECKNWNGVTVQIVIAMCLESALLTAWILKDAGISRTFAFRFMFALLNYMVFGNEMPGSIIVIAVFILFITMEAVDMIKEYKAGEKI